MKNIFRKALLIVLSAGLLLSLCGFAAGTTPDPKLINTQEFSVDGLLRLDVSYPSDRIVLKESAGEKIVLKEYLSYDDPGCRAVVTSENNVITIQGGERPQNSSYTSRMELFLPKDYAGSVNLRSASGKIESTGTSFAAAITMRSASGKIELKDIGFGLDCDTASGKIKISGSALKGSVSSAAGKIEIEAAALGGDLEVSAVSGKAELSFSASAAFELKASTVSGRISNELSSSFRFGGNSLTGSQGTNPQYTVEASTVSGNIVIGKL